MLRNRENMFGVLGGNPLVRFGDRDNGVGNDSPDVRSGDTDECGFKGYSIWYVNETCWLYSAGETYYMGTDLSDNTSHSGGTLTTHFQLTDIGSPEQLKFADTAGWTYDYAETGDTSSEYYYDMVPDESTGAGIDYEYDSRKIIPGFETAVLIGAIGISAVLFSRKLPGRRGK